MSWDTCSSATDSTTDSSSTIGGYISIPQSNSSYDSHSDSYSENNKQDIFSKKLSISKQSYKGQLRIEIYNQYGLLTIHFIAGRNLYSRRCNPPNTYIKVALIPEQNTNIKCKTDVYLNSNRPVYDEKFSFEVIEADSSKRLHISLWHCDDDHRDCEFLGCMSFGLNKILNKDQAISGWYYLLNGTLGRLRHVKVSEDGHVKKKNLNSNLCLMLLRRSRLGGFGFSLIGENPVRVSRLEEGSPAIHVGLAVKDAIIKVDGYDVTKLSSSEVARIIRNAKNEITLEVYKEGKEISKKNYGWLDEYSNINYSNENINKNYPCSNENMPINRQDNTYRTLSMNSSTTTKPKKSAFSHAITNSSDLTNIKLNQSKFNQKQSVNFGQQNLERIPESPENLSNINPDDLYSPFKTSLNYFQRKLKSTSLEDISNLSIGGTNPVKKLDTFKRFSFRLKKNDSLTTNRTNTISQKNHFSTNSLPTNSSPKSSQFFSRLKTIFKLKEDV